MTTSEVMLGYEYLEEVKKQTYLFVSGGKQNRKQVAPLLKLFLWYYIFLLCDLEENK